MLVQPGLTNFSIANFGLKLVLGLLDGTKEVEQFCQGKGFEEGLRTQDSVSLCVEESESNERSRLRLEDVSELGQWVLRLMEVKRD